jgi:hypothetical protein
MRVRDTQKSRVYAAEDAFRRLIDDRAIVDRVAAWAFIEKVERDKWFRRTYGVWSFRIKDGRGTRIARGGYGRLNLPRWSRTPVVMLHEISHNVTGAFECRGGAHGWEYCRAMLALVRHFLGREAHDKLRACYRERRVRYKRPRVLSEGQRTALAQRLAAYRQPL